jgi:DNA-binding transcriptional LysR family regulator
MAFALYASKDYLQKYGHPDWGTGAAGHYLITVQENYAALPEVLWLRRLASSATPCLFTNSWAAQVNACKAGLGLAWLPRYAADPEPGLTQIAVPKAPLGRDLWMGVLRDLQDAPRVREVLRVLSAFLKTQSTRITATS